MTSVSYITLLSNWFRVHVPLPQKSNNISGRRTGYAGAYPEIKRHHHRFSCIPLFNKPKKTNQTDLLNKSKINQKNSSIRGCASFARYDIYQEGDIEDDC